MADPATTALILAGGRAQRMQTACPGADKGLLPLAGRPLISWVIDNLQPQTQALLISANRHLNDYRRFTAQVIPDHYPDRPGPLAGIHAGLRHCTTDWLAVSACDTPFLPPHWVRQLHDALARRPGMIAYARTGQQPHPLVAILHRSLLNSLDDSLQAGAHRVRQWYQRHHALAVDFDTPAAFLNLNTPEDWQHVAHCLDPTGAPALPTGDHAP